MRVFLPLALLFSSSLSSIEDKRIIEIIQKISDQNDKMTKELSELKTLLGKSSLLKDLKPKQPTKKMKERVKIRLEDGIEAFEEKEFEKAKESFQLAFEALPDDFVTNFNLALSYERLGKPMLAKRMFKAALEIDPKIDDAKIIKQYIEGEKKEDKIDQSLKNTLVNLKKEAESYMRSSSFTLPERMKKSVAILRTMEKKASAEQDLVKNYFNWMSDTYAAFGMYQKSLSLLNTYEKKMKGEILPDGYHVKVLDLKSKLKEETESLEKYFQTEKEVDRALEKELNELTIFSTQIDQFVKEPNLEDRDFKKISERLGEYRWAGRKKRHVLVVSRYQELIYSSLKGTLSLERYQDVNGEPFLKNITKLSNHLKFKKSYSLEFDLKVGQSVVPYVVIYSYIPKHELFLIVRFPKKDLG